MLGSWSGWVCVGSLFLTAGHAHVCVHQENLQSCSQRVPGWLKKRQNDNATLIPQVVLRWTVAKSVLQFTTSSLVLVLAAGVSRLVQSGNGKCWEKGTDFTFRTVHSSEELKQPGALETNNWSAQNIAKFTEKLQQLWTKLQELCNFLHRLHMLYGTTKWNISNCSAQWKQSSSEQRRPPVKFASTQNAFPRKLIKSVRQLKCNPNLHAKVRHSNLTFPFSILWSWK